VVAGDEKKRLMQTGIFRTQNDVVLFLIGRSMGDSDVPLGAWTLKEKLEQCGIDCGTATVGRYLKELDSKGMTTRKSNQGRVLTEEGKIWVEQTRDNVLRAQMHNKSSRALRVDNYSDLLDLIRARKAIEVEGVRLAANCATSEEVTKLKNSVMIHYRYVAEGRDPTEPALEFHSILAAMSHNRFIKTMFDMLVFEERRIEDEMDQLLTRERGDIYVVEHDDILKAVAEKNEEQAAALMEQHLDALLSAVREQTQQMIAEESDQ